MRDKIICDTSFNGFRVMAYMEDFVPDERGKRDGELASRALKVMTQLEAQKTMSGMRLYKNNPG